MLPSSSPARPAAQTSKVYTLRRNSQGQLRFYDADGNEKVPSDERLEEELAQMDKATTPTPHDESGERLGGMLSAVGSTPPIEIVAVSPGSASQNLRRKAIHEGLEGQFKRARLSYEGPVSSPSAVGSCVATHQKEHTVIEISDESDAGGASSPGSDVDHVGTSSVEDPYVREFAGIFFDEDEDTYLEHDETDNAAITRCSHCGHEVWTVWMTQVGICTHCAWDPDAPDPTPYYEIIAPNSRPHPPEIEPAEFAGAYLDNLPPEYRTRKNIVGDYLDDHSDAYDTLDEGSGPRSEYDCDDNFIDDASIHSSQDVAKYENPENPPNEDDTTDYKALFKQLQQKHNRLKGRYDGMMRDFVYSDYERYSSSDEGLYESDIEEAGEEVDELGEVIIDVVPPGLAITVPNISQGQEQSQDVVPPGPTIAELVLSQAQEQSQQSEVSPDRISDRVKAFEAAAGENWNNISLISAGDNHTEVEIEL
jgi:hypothetical protein